MFFDTAPRPSRILRTLFGVLFVRGYSSPFFLQIRFIEYQLLTEPAAVTYESGLQLRVYRLDREESALSLQFFAVPDNYNIYKGLGYSVHVVDQLSGSSIAGSDDSAHRLDSSPYRDSW